MSGPAVLVPVQLAALVAKLLRYASTEIERRDGVLISPCIAPVVLALELATKARIDLAAQETVESETRQRAGTGAEACERWLTTAEAAEEIGISGRAVRGLCDRHSLASAKVRGCWRICKCSVRAYVHRSEPVTWCGNSGPPEQRLGSARVATAGQGPEISSEPA